MFSVSSFPSRHDQLDLLGRGVARSGGNGGQSAIKKTLFANLLTLRLCLLVSAYQSERPRRERPKDCGKYEPKQNWLEPYPASPALQRGFRLGGRPSKRHYLRQNSYSFVKIRSRPTVSDDRDVMSGLSLRKTLCRRFSARVS